MKSLLLPAVLLIACSEAANLPAPAAQDARVAADAGSVQTADASQSYKPSTRPPAPPPTRDFLSADVSIVYLMPTGVAGIEGLVSASEPAAFGPLLSESLAKSAPPPRIFAPNEGPGGPVATATWPHLRLVGLRLDPCFGVIGAHADAACPNQIRAIFESIRERETRVGDPTSPRSVGADDFALHVFYTLPRAELLAFASEVAELTLASGAYTAAPLGVHPVLAKEGATGAFARGLKERLLSHVGLSRITRMTFLSQTETLFWTMGFVDVANGVATPGMIATTGALKQTFTSANSLTDNRMEGVSSHPDSFGTLITTPGAGPEVKASSPATARGFYDGILRIQNPAQHSPDTIDCLSCHLAQPYQRSLERGYGLSATGNANAYVAPARQRLDTVTGKDISVLDLHFMSYLGPTLTISPRVANESAAVADALNTLLRPKI